MIRFLFFLFFLAVGTTALFVFFHWLFKNIIANRKASLEQWDEKRDDKTSERKFNMGQEDRVRRSEAHRRMRDKEDEADEDIFEENYE